MLPFRTSQNGQYINLEKPGVLLCTILPGADKKYDNELKQLFALSPVELSMIVTPEKCGYAENDAIQFVHETNEISKTLQISKLEGKYFFRIKEGDKLVRTFLTSAEMQTVRLVSQQILPALYGFHSVDGSEGSLIKSY